MTHKGWEKLLSFNSDCIRNKSIQAKTNEFILQGESHLSNLTQCVEFPVPYNSTLITKWKEDLHVKSTVHVIQYQFSWSVMITTAIETNANIATF